MCICGGRSGFTRVPPRSTRSCCWMISTTANPAGIPARLPLASASRHGDDHLPARRRGGARRQPGQQRRHRAGDVQWMTAGSGIIHQEMPTGAKRRQLRVPTVGEPAGGPQDDGAPLSRASAERDPAGTLDNGMTQRSSAARSGESQGR